VETLVARFQETGQNVAKQRNALVARTRTAGQALLAQTRGAGQDLIAFVQAEANRWRSFAAQRVDQAQTSVRTALSLRDLERKVLEQVGGRLRSIDDRVRARIAELTDDAAAAGPEEDPPESPEPTKKTRKTPRGKKLPAIAA
jgi:hypothetical protein